MPDRKLNIDVEINKKYKDTKSSGTDADSKAENERQKQRDKERLEQLKANLKQKQSLLDADIAKTQTQLKHAKDMELEAERHGNREKIKEMIAWRKMMESELRLLEANKRLANSKDLAEFKQNLRAKEKAQKDFDRLVRTAPRTKLAGDIGSLSYYKQVQSAQNTMLPGTDTFNKTGALLDSYKAKLVATGVDVRSLSQKIGGEFTSSLSKHRQELMSTLRTAGLLTIGVAGLTAALGRFSAESIKAFIDDERLSQSFKGTSEQMLQYRMAVANTVDDNILMKLSNQATNLGISFEQQVLMFKASRIAAKEMGIEIPEAFEMILNSTEGAIKGLTKLGLSKTKYNEILKDLVKSAGGEIEVTEAGNKEKEITIKNLGAEEQQKLRVQALNQLMQSTLGDLNNVETDNHEKTQQLVNIWGEMKEGFGGGLLSGILTVSDALGKSTDSGERQIKVMGHLKDAAKDLGQFLALGFVGNLAKWQYETSLKIEDVLRSWLGLKGRMEEPITPHVDLSGMQQDIQNMLQKNLNKYLEWQGDRPVDLTEQWKKHEIHQATRPDPKKNTGGNTKTHKEEKDAVDELIKSIDINIKQQELQLKLEGKKPALISETLRKELERLLALDRTNLKQEQLVKLLEKEVELRDKLASFIPKGQDAESKDPKSAPGTPKGSTPPRAKEQGSSDDNYYKKLQEIYDDIADAQISAFSQSLSLAQQIDQVLGGGAGEVIRAFQTAYSITQAIIELINTIDTISSLFDLIPGVGALGAIPGLAGGGRASAGTLYEWNEEGKELFIPTKNGYVLDADNFNRFSGAVLSMSNSMNRDRDMVSNPRLSEMSQPIIVQNILKNVVPFRKAFETETISYNARTVATRG